MDEVADLFNSAVVLGTQPLPKGPNLAIITNAGGLGIMATDALIAKGGNLAELSQKTMETLSNVLPHYWSRGNPIDVLGDAKADRFKTVVGACLNDENVDGLLIIYAPQAGADPTEIAKSIVDLCKSKGYRNKTVLTCFMGHEEVEEANRVFSENNTPTYSTPEQAVKTYVYMYQYERNLELLYETPEELPVDVVSPKRPLLVIMRNAAMENREMLTEAETKTFLEYYGISVARTLTARTADEAAALGSRHKTRLLGSNQGLSVD